mmetsp:Transcript_18596/g.25801  ORF Transcript_18596/g.25801 Transcript_18596/m.25801 type:complete len:442 (+) Transcript_18596:139-1464(+)
MKRRVHHSRSEDLNNFRFGTEEGELSPSASPRKNNQTSSKNYYGYVLFLVAVMIIVTLVVKQSDSVNDGDQIIGEEKIVEKLDTLSNTEDHDADFNRDDGMSIFDRCDYPSTKLHAAPLCRYFHPVRFFQKDQPGYAYRSVLSSFKETSTRRGSNLTSKNRVGTIFSRWAWQCNNWPEGGPRLELSTKSKIPRHAVESVTAFATPKVGSRTLWKLFLDHIAIPKKPIQKDRRVGDVNSTYITNLLQRQASDSQQPGSPRRNIVFAVMRNPVQRFISAMGEVMSSRGTSRCVECKKYLEPCLSDVDGLTSTSAPDVLLCTLQSIKTNGFFNEHLVPHAMFLTRLLNGNDIEIAVFPLEHLDNIVSEFGVENAIKANPRTRKNVDADNPTGLVENFLSILKDSSSEVNAKIIREICSVYAVDVSIMKYLGFPVKYCDDSHINS